MNYQFIPNNSLKPSKKKLQIRCDCSFNFRESTFSEQGRILRMPLTFGKFRIRNNRGVMKKWVSEKGFGFISEEGSENEHFVHVSGLVDEVAQGDEVTFELQEGRKGMNAVDVKLA